MHLRICSLQKLSRCLPHCRGLSLSARTSSLCTCISSCCAGNTPCRSLSWKTTGRDWTSQSERRACWNRNSPIICPPHSPTQLVPPRPGARGAFEFMEACFTRVYLRCALIGIFRTAPETLKYSTTQRGCSYCIPRVAVVDLSPLPAVNSPVSMPSLPV